MSTFQLRRRAMLYFFLTAAALSAYAFFMVRAWTKGSCEVLNLEDGRIQLKASGYRDYIVFTARRGPSGSYTDLELVSANESPLYASRKDIRAYLARLDGVAPGRIREIDGITGATVTVQAIRNALLQASGSPFARWKEMGAVTLLWALALVLSFLRLPKLKKIFYVAAGIISLGVVGILTNSPVSVYALFSWRSFFQLLPLLALIGALLYRNIYCGRICPFGFLSWAVANIPLGRRFRLPRVLRIGKFILLGVAVASFLLDRQLYLEPYTYLFSRSTVPWIYLLPVAMLAVSAFIPRFWCRGFCPLGAVMEIARAVRLWGLKAEAPRLALAPGGSSNERNAVWLAVLPFGLILLSNLLLYLLLTP